NGKRILLVDDDKDLLHLISMRLGASGYAVSTAESGESALAAMAVSPPELVITDLRMEGMDGLALFDAIHREAPALPVVILTAHGTIPEAVAPTRRGHAPRGVRVSHQALRSQGPARHRRDGAAPLGCTGGRRRVLARGNGDALPGDGVAARAGEARRRVRCGDLHSRRERHRQGIA